MKTGLAIEDLAAEVMRENSVKLDYVVNSRDLRMETTSCYSFICFCVFWIRTATV